jgi:glycosyltransferase involved in cell wall biosynthesis
MRGYRFALATADLMVLPSFWEGLPLAAIESLAAGCPVVATEVDGTPEVAVDGITGFIVPPGDPNRLADAICDLLRKPKLRERMAIAGRLWVTARFSQERQISQTEDLYLNALELSRVGTRTVTETTSIDKGSLEMPAAEQNR